MKFNIPQEQEHVFKSVAYMIERKLLNMQMTLIAHRYPLRTVCIEYNEILSEEKLAKIESGINSLYDLLVAFCEDYGV